MQIVRHLLLLATVTQIKTQVYIINNKNSPGTRIAYQGSRLVTRGGIEPPLSA